MQGIVGVFAPVAGCGDDDAVGKRLFTGCGKEAVNITLLDAVIFCIKLALNGVVFSRALGLCYQVNAGIV